jgi:hypothetical protein
MDAKMGYGQSKKMLVFISSTEGVLCFHTMVYKQGHEASYSQNHNKPFTDKAGILSASFYTSQGRVSRIDEFLLWEYHQ